MCSFFFFFCLSEQEAHGQSEEGSEGGAQRPGCWWHWPVETAPWALHFLWAAQLPRSLVSLSVPAPPVSMFPWCSCLCRIHQWVCFLGVAVCAWFTVSVSLVWLCLPDPPVSMFPWCGFLSLIHQWVCFLGVCAWYTSEYVCLIHQYVSLGLWLILHKTIPYFSLDSVLCRYSSEVPRRMEGDSMFCL